MGLYMQGTLKKTRRGFLIWERGAARPYQGEAVASCDGRMQSLLFRVLPGEQKSPTLWDRASENGEGG